MADIAPTWLYVVGAFTFLALLIWMRKECYKQGIWDGAFNQSLPHVQMAMIDYRGQDASDHLLNKGIPITRDVRMYALTRYGINIPCPREHTEYDDCPDCCH